MKSSLTTLVLGIICPILLISCSDDKSNFNVSKYETPDFWNNNCFQPINDEFSDFRKFEVGLIYPYDHSNPRVEAMLNLPGMINTNVSGYNWIEVVYPKNNPSKVTYSVYKTYPSKTNYIGYNLSKMDLTDIILFESFLYKDGKQIGKLEYMDSGRAILHTKKSRQLLHDDRKLILASNELYHSNNSDIPGKKLYMTFSEVPDLFSSLEFGTEEVCLLTAKDPYGGKLLQLFGSLASFLLPINGPCSDDMVQEVIGLRNTDYYVGGTSPVSSFFIYKNSESPAAPYLPESVWDINDFSLWNN